MSEFLPNNPPVHESFLVDPSDTTFEGEHALSLQIATQLSDLHSLRQHLDPDWSYTLDTHVAEQLQQRVTATYNEHFAADAILISPEAELWRRTDPAYERPLGKEIYTINKYLYELWWNEYYTPRTHKATHDDFQRWLDTYTTAYGGDPLKTRQTDASFHDIYRTFDGRKARDLRITHEDVLLVPGRYRGEIVSIIEAPATIVDRALPSIDHRHRVFSNRVPPENVYFTVEIPNDIVFPSNHDRNV